MKNVLTILIILFITSCNKAPQNEPKTLMANNCEARGCSGSEYCTACKNCSGCKHCAKEGGTCGVCSKPTKKKTTTTPRKKTKKK